MYFFSSYRSEDLVGREEDSRDPSHAHIAAHRNRDCRVGRFILNISPHPSDRVPETKLGETDNGRPRCPDNRKFYLLSVLFYFLH